MKFFFECVIEENIEVIFLASFSSQPIWWHYMVVTVPKVLRRGDKAFMLISSGANTDAIPTTSWTSNVSLAVGSVAVELKQIPNQPIIFKVFSIFFEYDQLFFVV